MKRALLFFCFLLTACASRPAFKPAPPSFSITNPAVSDADAPVILLSQPLSDPKRLQILEVYVLPRQGMSIRQIRANIPGIGVVNLVDPSAASAEARSFSTTTQITSEQATLTGILQSQDSEIAVTTALNKKSLILSMFVKNPGNRPLELKASWFPPFHLLRAKSRLMRKRSVAEIVDPSAHYGLRLRSVSPDIRTFRIHAPVQEDFETVEPRFEPETLRIPPGETEKCAVELELFAFNR